MDFLDIELFSTGSYVLKMHQLISVLLISILSVTLFRWVAFYLKPKLEAWSAIDEDNRRKLLRIIRLLFFFLAILGLIFVLKLNFNLSPNDNNPISISFLLEALSIIQFARLLDWVVSNYFIHRNFVKRDEEKEKLERTSPTRDPEGKATKTVQYLVYVIAIILILRNFDYDPTLYTLNLKDNESFPIKITNILSAVAIFLIMRLIVWVLTHLVLYGYYKQKNIEIGAQFAVNQLISYVGYVIAVLMGLEILGINMTLIWGGAAALLVGVGLGLQQTFNDFISGIVLLFERTVKVGDIVQMEGNLVGIIRKIGMRASIVETRDSVSVVVPNSKLVNQNVINWSHVSNRVRFFVSVGVAYGSDTALVKKLLLEAANGNKRVLKYPPPFVRFKNFGDSSLVFELYFFTKELIPEEDTKSDLRFKIDELFRAHKIKIPFPQSELYIHKMGD